MQNNLFPFNTQKLNKLLITLSKTHIETLVMHVSGFKKLKTSKATILILFQKLILLLHLK